MPAETGPDGPSSALREIPPSGLHGRKARPERSLSRSSASLPRTAGEYWFCTETGASPRTTRAARICPLVTLEIPAARIVPASSSSRSAPTESVHGTSGSGLCSW